MSEEESTMSRRKLVLQDRYLVFTSEPMCNYEYGKGFAAGVRLALLAAGRLDLLTIGRDTFSSDSQEAGPAQ